MPQNAANIVHVGNSGIVPPMKMEYDIGTADIMNLRRNEMAQQNIYDNEIFFEGYKKIRDNKVNANNLFEIPALFSLLPDLTGKKIID